MLKKIVWVKADGNDPWESRKKLVTAALEAGADGVILPAGEANKAKELGLIDIIAEAPAPNVDIVMLKAETTDEVDWAISSAKKLREEGKKVAILVEITSKELERSAVKAAKAADFIVAVGRDWRVIPLENIIAELHRSEVKVLAGVKDADEGRTAIETLEIGADGVMLDPSERGASEIKRVCETFEALSMEKLELTPVKIRSIKRVGMGDRACVDTNTMMGLGEGILVGNQSECLFLVHSESLASEYVEPRPFRVNAGAVSAYIRLPGGKTKYLSELKSGDEVLIVNHKGESRVSTIGRVKIERRPLLLIEAEHCEMTFKTVLQNAETINLVTKDGRPISVTSLKPNDEVLAYLERAGRHFGIKVEETILEK
jgi:3-dehydroquinate synthase II